MLPLPIAAAALPQVSITTYEDFEWKVMTLCSEFYDAAQQIIVRHPLYLRTSLFP